MTREARCSFCLRAQSQVDHLFMGPGAASDERAPRICNRCVGTLVAMLQEKGVPLTPDLYCRACGFRTSGHESKPVVTGVVCRNCAEKLSAWFLTAPPEPT